MTKQDYDEAMEEMECWSVQNHLKDCKKCALQAKQEGIEGCIELVKDEEEHAPYCPDDITEPGSWFLGRMYGLLAVIEKLEIKLSELKKKGKK